MGCPFLLLSRYFRNFDQEGRSPFENSLLSKKKKDRENEENFRNFSPLSRASTNYFAFCKS